MRSADGQVPPRKQTTAPTVIQPICPSHFNKLGISKNILPALWRSKITQNVCKTIKFAGTGYAHISSAYPSKLKPNILCKLDPCLIGISFRKGKKIDDLVIDSQLYNHHQAIVYCRQISVAAQSGFQRHFQPVRLLATNVLSMTDLNAHHPRLCWHKHQPESREPFVALIINRKHGELRRFKHTNDTLQNI